jgi:hypothetical protein
MSTLNAGPSQKKNCGSQQQVMNRETNPGDGPALYPSRIVVGCSRCNLALQHSLQFTYSVYGRKPGLTEIDLISIFKRTQQLHSVERTEVQVRFEICTRREL